MRQSEILFYARHYCSDKEYQARQMYYESGDKSFLKDAERYNEKWLELDRMLVNAWNVEVRDEGTESNH